MCTEHSPKTNLKLLIKKLYTICNFDIDYIYKKVVRYTNGVNLKNLNFTLRSVQCEFRNKKGILTVQ